MGFDPDRGCLIGLGQLCRGAHLKSSYAIKCYATEDQCKASSVESYKVTVNNSK